MTPVERNVEGAGRYKLAPGAQVREEEFGLLFYHRAGPRLYFLNCGPLLDEHFFAGEFTLEKWMDRNTAGVSITPSKILSLKKNLDKLKKKGVILEC